jgi:hypothetical protein
MVRRSTSVPPSSAPIIIGVDDFAWKRGQRYGTVICDLEHRRIIDSCQTATQPQLRRGWPTIPASELSLAIGAPVMVMA